MGVIDMFICFWENSFLSWDCISSTIGTANFLAFIVIFYATFTFYRMYRIEKRIEKRNY